jgi:hypothetical protein
MIKKATNSRKSSRPFFLLALMIPNCLLVIAIEKLNKDIDFQLVH